MNDPGYDQRLPETSETIKHKYEDKENADSEMDEEEEKKSFLLPTRWWYASTAFPLIAGTFGPTANAFSICALVENWRTDIPSGGTEEHGIDIKDPTWCVCAIHLSKTSFDGLVPYDGSWSFTVKARRLFSVGTGILPNIIIRC
jgi:potassium channel subfamily K, other eukaryote